MFPAYYTKTPVRNHNADAEGFLLHTMKVIRELSRADTKFFCLRRQYSSEHLDVVNLCYMCLRIQSFDKLMGALHHVTDVRA